MLYGSHLNLGVETGLEDRSKLLEFVYHYLRMWPVTKSS
jgi:hypothetical protein